jgi:hypothetical protein
MALVEDENNTRIKWAAPGSPRGVMDVGIQKVRGVDIVWLTYGPGCLSMSMSTFKQFVQDTKDGKWDEIVNGER